MVTSARGADIHSLREKGISYIELEQPDKQIVPRIDSATPKSSVRGHKHPVLSRLLCPVKYLEADFDVNPAEYVAFIRTKDSIHLPPGSKTNCVITRFESPLEIFLHSYMPMVATIPTTPKVDFFVIRY